MRTADFDYDLPARYIAQTPLEPRDSSRLLILDRKSGEIQHTIFKEIGKYLKSGDTLVANETRVIPARLFARKIPSGGKVELLLLRKKDDQTWEVLVGGKGLTMGKQFQVVPFDHIVDAPTAEIIQEMEGAERLVRFDQPLETYFPTIGHVPLPPYIHTQLLDPERYQTVYANIAGSAAAPTAGLHFTPQLIKSLTHKGILFSKVTLHVGLDTFAPVNEDDPREHKIHTEWCSVSQETAYQLNDAKERGAQVIAIGTTSVRTLESAASGGMMRKYDGPTNLYILPGYKFQVVDAMITNFHLPRSTLIMLVSAFAGQDNVMNAYEVAKKENYRFYSFGDAMLII